MSVKSGVSTTPHSVMTNPEIQDQWHRVMRRAKKVSKLINHPVVFLFGTRVGGTRVKVIP